MNNVSKVGLVGDGMGPRTPNKKSGSAAGRYRHDGICSHSNSSPTVMVLFPGSLEAVAGEAAEVKVVVVELDCDRPAGSRDGDTAEGVSRSLKMIASSNLIPRISILVSTSTW